MALLVADVASVCRRMERAVPRAAKTTEQVEQVQVRSVGNERPIWPREKAQALL